MSLRVLLALQIILALAALFLVFFVANTWFYSMVAAENVTGVRAFLVWLSGPLGFELTVAPLAGAVISVICFIVANVLVVRPVRAICKAMEDFAKTGVHQDLPAFSGSPAEIKNFSRVWSEFAGRVEESHARDTEMSRMKSDFISTAAHQLRTPLTGIRWALEALGKEDLTESQRALMKSAVDKSHDLVGIVGTLLDISSIESGKYKYHLASVDLNELVAEVANDFLPLAGQSGVVLTLEPLQGLPHVQIDRERMKWVLNNLVENAIRYTPSGGSVHLSTATVSGRVMVYVRDTGIGIRTEDRNNIFERFYRAGNAVAKENQGNGLGLYIARSIVNDHKGELSFAANQEGPGTTFILALPMSS